MSTDAKTAPIFQPATYAEKLAGYVMWEMDRHLDHGALTFFAPQEAAEFNLVERRLYAEIPGLESARFHEMNEAAMGWVNAAYVAGVRHGAAYEALRRELVGPVGQCPKCWGYGHLQDDGSIAHTGQPGHACEFCNGAGFVPAATIEALPKRLHATATE